MTMTEVAKRAGVSQATVSRVVNGANNVSDAVVELVNEAMRELGYEPRLRRKATGSARSASETTQGTVVLVMLDDSMNSLPTLALAKLRGVEAAVSREGLSLVVTRVDDSRERPAALKRKDVVGVLLWGRRADATLEHHLERVPTMWLSSHAEAGGNKILVGNEQAGRLAAEYLLGRGVKRPAFLCPTTSRAQYELRGNGFGYGFHLAGIETHMVTHECREGCSFEQLERKEQTEVIDTLVSQLLALKPKPDGLFVPDDAITSLVYPALYRRGACPGTGLLVVSCGNEPAYLGGLHPRPATIDLGPEATGRLAVEQLLWKIRHPDSPDRVSMLVEPRLVPGEEVV